MLCLSNCGENFCSAGHEEEAFLGHYSTVGNDGKFAAIAIDYLHIQSGFIPQRFRQTGSMLANRTSDRALPNRDLFHRNSPLQANNDHMQLIAARRVPRRINSPPDLAPCWGVVWPAVGCRASAYGKRMEAGARPNL
jgi:hypothetical protein